MSGRGARAARRRTRARRAVGLDANGRATRKPRSQRAWARRVVRGGSAGQAGACSGVPGRHSWGEAGERRARGDAGAGRDGATARPRAAGSAFRPTSRTLARGAESPGPECAAAAFRGTQLRGRPRVRGSANRAARRAARGGDVPGSEQRAKHEWAEDGGVEGATFLAGGPAGRAGAERACLGCGDEGGREGSGRARPSAGWCAGRRAIPRVAEGGIESGGPRRGGGG